MARSGDRGDGGWDIVWRACGGLAVVFVLLAASGAMATGPALLGCAAGCIAIALSRAGVRATSSQGRSTSEAGAEASPVALLVQSLPGPALLIEADDAILAFNVRARDLMPGLAAGAPVSSATRNPDLLAGIRSARADGTQHRVQYEDRVPIERRIEAVIAPVRTETGGPLRLIVALRDLTEAARVEEMRADFVANASHELRTPLASLRGYIETLQGPAHNDPAARDRFLAIMATQAARMTRLIDDLMSLSRIEMREHVAPSGIVDVTEVVQEVAQMLEPLAEEAKVTLDVAPMEAPLLVRGDAEELEQVVQNLAQNAIKYGRSGGHVRISAAVEGAGERRVSISVADDGPGIAPEHLPRLTERFYRVDVPQSRNRGGTGLGLAIVKHILNRHRGQLLIRSEEGRGSTFTASLPAA